VQNFIRRLTDAFVSDELKIDSDKQDVLMRPGSIDYMNQQLKQLGVKATVQTSDSTMIVRAATQSDFKNATQQIDKVLLVREIPLTDETIIALTQPEWKSFTNDVEQQYTLSKIRVSDDTSKLVVVGLVDFMDVLCNEVQQALEENMQLEQIFDLDADIVQYAEKYLVPRLNVLQQEFGVHYEIKEDKVFSVTGKQEFVLLAVEKFNDLFQGVIKFHHPASYAIMKYFSSQRGAAAIEGLQSKHQVT
jgi:hypothetical protein